MDVGDALQTMASLPRRATGSQADAQAWIGGYIEALDGVAYDDLRDVTSKALRGEIGNGFFPSSAEMRMACDGLSARRGAHDREAREIRHQQETRDAWRASQAAKTPESRARVLEVYRRFVEANEAAVAAYRLERRGATSSLTPEMQEIIDSLKGRPVRIGVRRHV
jgi:hypothetical protein